MPSQNRLSDLDREQSHFFNMRLLADAIDRPAIVTNDDTARTRKSDPQPSHDAADRSQSTIRAIRDAVLTLVSLHQPGLTGSEINDLYDTFAPRNGWPKARWDSPRKRAGELARDGLLERSDASGRTEGVYTVTEAGIKAVSS